MKLICIKFDNESPHDLIPGKQYHVEYTTIEWSKQSNKKLYVIYSEENKFTGFFDYQNLNTYFKPLEEFRDNNIDKILQ